MGATKSCGGARHGAALGGALTMTLVLLIVAAVLEVGGDALCRAGVRGGKVGLLILGGVVLWLYGITVNAPRWHFGRLLGVYIAVFFVVSQIVAVGIFREPSSPSRLLGGALIVAGGLVLSCWP